MRIVSYLLSGEILFSGHHDEVPPPTITDIEIRHLAHETADRHTHWVDMSDPVNPAVREYSEKGQARKTVTVSVEHRWDPAVEDWIDERGVAQIAEDLIAALQARRDALIFGGFGWDGSVFHSDKEVSQPRLLGLYTDALNDNFTPGGEWWRLKDGTWRLLQAEDAIAVWQAMKAHIQNLFGIYANHEALVLLALENDDRQALLDHAVDWGWPA
ncbi:MAG TPA: DUF4376 domain-containing protein [Burkholderiaceae bacterium]|nr:DUF4376 domain-containing protein [Burkholderiaceae bacterium]